METFFFGSGARQLFGCYHPPASGRIRRSGVVVCGSVAEEYITFHRALRQLAVLLAEEGFPVLRFDLSATGDSGGSCEEGRVELWLEDVEEAVEELRRRSSSTGLALAGLRLGGALAYATGVRRGDVNAMALWDPVVDGGVYVDELVSLHRDMLEYAHVEAATKGGDALWGLPESGATWTSVRAVDLLALGGVPAREVLVLETDERAPLSPLCDHLGQRDVRVTRASLPRQQLWTWLEDFSKVSVPLPVLRTLIDWLCEVSS